MYLYTRLRFHAGMLILEFCQSNFDNFGLESVSQVYFELTVIVKMPVWDYFSENWKNSLTLKSLRISSWGLF